MVTLYKITYFELNTSKLTISVRTDLYADNSHQDQVRIVSLASQDRCRATVLRHLTREEQIDELELPRCLKRFISEGLEDFPTDVELTQNNLS